MIWALAHGLLAVLFFSASLSRAASIHSPLLKTGLWLGFFIEALALGLLVFALTLPFRILGRRWAWAAAIVIAACTGFLYLDSLVQASLGFHVNRLVLQVALQPGALTETGLPLAEIVLLVAGGIALFVVDVWLGVRFIRGFARPRRSWPLVLAILSLWLCERVAMAALTFTRGQAILAASSTLPLQPPVRMNTLLGKITGRKAMEELKLEALPQAGTPPGNLEAREVRLRRKPDVIFLLVESLRDDFFTPEVMPNLSRRAAAGTRFTRHFSTASSTHFSLFSLFYGLDAQRRDAIIGAGRSPLLFPALRENGYRLELFAASSVDWMDLKETVFKDVDEGLQTDFKGRGAERDAQMIEAAEKLLAEASDDEPLFLFLFFDGTHFNYSYPPESERFVPAWDGKGSLRAAANVEPELLRNRARNAAYEVDRKIERLLTRFEQERPGKPLILFTSDHGEEYRELGRVGHASDVTALQLHVPFVLIDETLEPGERSHVTGHADVLPTLLSLLGDENDAGLYADGQPMQRAQAGRYVLATVGWEPRFALIGDELKVRFLGQDGGLGGVTITDPLDRPLADGKERFSLEAPRLLRRLKGNDAVHAAR